MSTPVSQFVPLYLSLQASLVAQTVKHLPAMRETWVRFLGREDPLKKEMATHSSILAWEIPRMEEPGGPPRPWGEEPCPVDTFITVALELGAGHLLWASLIAQLVKNLPVMQETQVLFLGREDPLKKEMATHSSILA